MSKKERNMNEATFMPSELGVEEETIYEADAYTSPQPDEGSDVTVLKPVGMGGPVPIVAPKHNTIQLQPIIVPLAVVPYMTQDSSVLRTDGRTQQPGYAHDDGEAADIKAAGKDKTKKKVRPMARVFSLITLLLAVVTTLPYIFCYTDVTIGKLDFLEFDSMVLIDWWANKIISFSFTPISNILGIVIMGMSMLIALFSLIGLIIGKYPKPLVCIFLFVALGCLVAELIIDIIGKAFFPQERIIFIVMLAVMCLSFILSVVFSLLINKREDKEEELESEI